MTEGDRKARYKVNSKSIQDDAGRLDQVESDMGDCASCGHANASDSLFCSECGASLKAPRVCLRCGASVVFGADICEACGTWLLPGQCMFCSAPVAENQTYCGTCGNPTTGIPCPSCGNPSYFDFCKTCSIPLSSQAHQLALIASNDPAQQEIASLLKELQASQPDSSNIIDAERTPAIPEVAVDDQLGKMKYSRAMLSVPRMSGYERAKSALLFSDEQKKHINELGDQIIQEEERQRLEKEKLRLEAEQKHREQEERRRKVQKQINQALSRLEGKTFTSNQDARRFFMTLVSALPEEAMRALNISGRLQWRCHAYSCEHDSPAECGDPSKGGVWFII